MPRGNGHDDAREDETKQTEQVLAEARMVLPGLLSLLGLQIMAVFDEVFHERLAAWEQYLHALALVLIVFGITLVLTPAAYHRVVAPCEVPANFPRIAGGFMLVSMIPMLMVLTIDVYIGTRLVFDTPYPSAALAGTMMAWMLGLWFVFPAVVRRRQRRHA